MAKIEEVRGIYCTILDEKSKRGQNALASAKKVSGRRLSDVYTRPSKTKEELYDSWLEVFGEMEHATNFHICGANCNFFSLSWDVPEGTFYITYANDYFIRREN